MLTLSLLRSGYYDKRGKPTESLHAFEACVAKGEAIKARHAAIAGAAMNCSRKAVAKGPAPGANLITSRRTTDHLTPHEDGRADPT